MTSSVLITGISGGIGGALAVAFRRSGYRIIGADRKPPQGQVCEVFVQVDLNEVAENDEALAAFVTDVRLGSAHAPLRVLVNNAAAQLLARIELLTGADWRETMNVNLTAPFRLSQAFIGDLEEADGVILNIGSVHAHATKPEFTAYATSKAALHGLTRAMAVELGSRVRVVCLAPAAIATPMLIAGIAGKGASLTKLESCHPVGRIGTPDEAAEVAVFMASHAAAFATGSTVWLDGGVLSRLHDPI